MVFTWLLAARWNFYSLVDIAWAYGIGLIALIYGSIGEGEASRRGLLSTLAALWSLRLGTHLLIRLKAEFPNEDRRYAKLKTAWGPSAKRNFFWVFQSQAASQPILCIPLALAAESASSLSALDFLAVFICLIGLLGEAASDAQLKRFKADPQNSGHVCNAGIWRYSRHPNYFFEWIIWCGFACLGLSGPWGWISSFSPILMFFLLNFVTGVPPAEAQSLLSKGDLYRQYQRQTSRFFPWFPKGAKA
jgi:steroid 5-alpha reductase family enzyme